MKSNLIALNGRPFGHFYDSKIGRTEEDVKAMSCLPHFQENLENKEDQVKQQAEDTKLKRQVNVTLQLGDTTQQTLKKIKTFIKGNTNNDCLKSYYITPCSIFPQHRKFNRILLISNS